MLYGTDLDTNPSLAEQCVFYSRKQHNNHTSDAQSRMEDNVDNQDFEGAASANEVATSACRSKSEVAQRVCKDGGDAVPTTIVKEIGPACEGEEQNHGNATLFDQITGVEDELV